jgi:CelD/BcsL family acetyltransferase involved in cellulose biosynthesis
MHAVRVDSTLAAAVGSTRRLRRQGGLDRTVHRRLDLAGATFDEVMAARSSKSRGSIRRYAKRLERDMAGQLEIRVYEDIADLEVVVRDLEAVASTTYQHGLGVGFQGTPLVRRILGLTMERGQFRAYVLYVRGAPIAFWQGYLSGGAFRTDFTGFDPAYAEYRVGTYVLLEVIADCCRRDDITAIDFGIGEAEYKQRFGNESWLDVDVLLYGRGLRLGAVDAVRTVTIAANRGLVALARRSAMLRRLKRGWRRRLSNP